MNTSGSFSISPGYFLGQEASSLPVNVLFRRQDRYFRSFTGVDAAKRFFEQIAGKVDGLDYVNYWYEPCDGQEARKIGEIGRSYGIDLWAGIRWCKQFRDLPVVPGDYAAWTMEETGRIVPYLWEQRNHFFDYLNPAAVDWMLDILETRYWPYVKGVVNGLLLPEAGIHTRWFMDRTGVSPWSLRAYSPYVLECWRNYCLEHDLRLDGKVVDRFPVSRPGMTGPHPDKTIYVPDDRPAAVPAFTRFIEIPRGLAVWLAWEDFLCEMYHRNFVHRIAERVNRYHAGVSDWRGVCYFQMDTAMLDYRDFTHPSARTGLSAGYWPQGRRMGVDIHRLLQDEEIKCFITETFASPREFLDQEENVVSAGFDLAARYGRSGDYGVLLHGCESWGGIGDIRTPGACVWDREEEDRRWELIHKYQPALLSFYSVPALLVREGAWYEKTAADYFWSRLAEYKKVIRSKNKGAGDANAT
jgi:hypothetical protein